MLKLKITKINRHAWIFYTKTGVKFATNTTLCMYLYSSSCYSMMYKNWMFTDINDIIKEIDKDINSGIKIRVGPLA